MFLYLVNLMCKIGLGLISKARAFLEGPRKLVLQVSKNPVDPEQICTNSKNTRRKSKGSPEFWSQRDTVRQQAGGQSLWPWLWLLRMPLQSRQSLTLSSMDKGAPRFGGQAEVPSLQSVSSLPWEMVSSPFSSLADFICISPDPFLFPSAWAVS